MFKSLIIPAIILAGTIIGAGFFALPFLFQEAGLVSGLFLLACLVPVMWLIHAMYADVIIKNKEGLHFPAYAKKYLGQGGYALSLLAVILGMFLTLTVYLLLSTSFFAIIFPNTPPLTSLILFWIISSVPVFLALKKIAGLEIFATLGMFTMIVAIFFIGKNNFNFGEFAFPKSAVLAFIPYGAILFSLAGRTAIPVVVDYFRKNKIAFKKISSALFLGTILPAALYALFVIGTLGMTKSVSGSSIKEIAAGLPTSMAVLFGILGLFSLWSSYITIGKDTEQSLKNDLRFGPILSGIITILLPIILFIAGFNNFIKLVGIIGGVFSGIEGLLVIAIWKKAQQDPQRGIVLNPPKIILALLTVIFTAGIFYSLIF